MKIERQAPIVAQSVQFWRVIPDLGIVESPVG